ncbi:Vacuolar-sorting protein SNF7 [Babesia sp. Xinjiang]|uniref:Vacuolar-sorting protein SNF7 n=1 Tax=Babesia sp. Xinjiang TaxID=462227 RepID=UPI000A22ECD6|nr:Vacuolar-sorting protein SNF7 [Babesia sp. Xinjiang]ORM41060.1 Vacuolar-sorting protein SNF7 [Babesia sp. Xinjiang]
MVFGLLRRAKKGSIREPSANNRDDVQSALAMGQQAIRDMNDRLRVLEERIKDCVAEAKEKYSKNDKAGALGALRRKKLYEEEATRVTSSIMTLETQNITLEGAQMQQLALSALSTGAAAHKRFQECMATTEVDKLMDQLEEQRENQLEIYDAMTQGVSLPTEFEDELDALMQEEFAKEAALEQSIDIAAESLASVVEQPVVEPEAPNESLQTRTRVSEATEPSAIAQ